MKSSLKATLETFYPLTKERNILGRLRDVLGHKQQEDGEGQQDGDPERHLLAGVGRQVEDENGQQRHHHARRNNVDQVEHRLPAQVKREPDAWKRNAGVRLVELVAAGRLRAQDVPLAAVRVRVQAHPVGAVDELHLQAVVGPVHQVDVAHLVVERIEGDVELTRRHELAARHPVDEAVVGDAHAEALVEQLVVDRLGAAGVNEWYECTLVNQFGMCRVTTERPKDTICRWLIVVYIFRMVHTFKKYT